MKVVGGGNDRDGKAGRVGIEVVGMERQFATVVADCQPAPFNQREDIAGEESLRLVRGNTTLLLPRPNMGCSRFEEFSCDTSLPNIPFSLHGLP